LNLYAASGCSACCPRVRKEKQVPKTGMTDSDERDHWANRFESLERELEEIKETLHKVQSSIKELERERQRDGHEKNETLSSCSFELLDQEDRTRSRLEVSSEGQPGLSFYDEGGVCRASFALNERNYPELFLTNLTSKGLAAGKNYGRVLLGFDDDGYPRLEMYDSDALDLEPAVSLTVHRTETGREAGLSLQVWSDDGRLTMEYFGARVRNRPTDPSFPGKP